MTQGAPQRHGPPEGNEHLRGSVDSATEAQDLGTVSYTASEWEFLLAAGFTPDDFAPARLREVAEAVAAINREDERNRPKRLTTAEVAHLLQVTPATVRRMRARGELQADGRIGRATAYPPWQFTPEGRPLRMLRQILPAFPHDWDPKDVERFMTTPDEDFDGITPKQWLQDGGPVRRLVTYLNDLSWL